MIWWNGMARFGIIGSYGNKPSRSRHAHTSWWIWYKMVMQTKLIMNRLSTTLQWINTEHINMDLRLDIGISYNTGLSMPALQIHLGPHVVCKGTNHSHHRSSKSLVNTWYHKGMLCCSPALRHTVNGQAGVHALVPVAQECLAEQATVCKPYAFSYCKIMLLSITS